MRRYNLADLYRYEGSKCFSLKTQLRYLLVVPGFQYTWCLRHTQNASNRITYFLWRLLLRLLMYHTGIQIPASTKIGPGLKIAHWGTIVVNPGAMIGRNFGIAHGCLIGNSQGKQHGVPRIGDCVTMGANSIVVGGVKIGDNVLIAPGAFVNFDVPDNSIVIGNPGKIIPRTTSPTQKYMVYPLPDNF